MQFNFNEVHEGLNPGAGCRVAGPLGTCSDLAPAQATGTRPFFDPESCEHRHHFRRWNRVRKDFGFDDGSLRRSQWQLVPLGETREVTFLWDRLSPKRIFVEHSHIASVDEQLGRYVISGLRSGSTGLHAANARGICRSELEITVRQPKQISVVFHYVKDKRHNTVRAVGSGGKLLADVNEIIAPQTCISFGEKFNPTPVFEIDADLGDFVDPLAANAKRLCAERIKELQTSSAINVFFVWKIPGVAGETTGGQMLDNLTCFIADDTKKNAGRALAHELGHCLTRFDSDDLYRDHEGHTVDTEYLMDRLASGTRISRKEADVMYRTAVDDTGAQ